MDVSHEVARGLSAAGVRTLEQAKHSQPTGFTGPGPVAGVRPEPSLALRTAWVFADDSVRGVEICQGLAGFQICDFPLADLAHERPARRAKSKPDVVLVECAAPDNLLIDTVALLSEREDCAAIIFADCDDSDLIALALRRGITSYIVGGLQREKVELIARVALERFQIQRQLKAEVHKLRSELEARKVIEKAKGVIMERRSLSEAEAYKTLREVAMKSGRPLRDLSRDVLHLARVLGPDNVDDLDQLAQLFTARERGVTRMARDILTAASLLGER